MSQTMKRDASRPWVLAVKFMDGRFAVHGPFDSAAQAEGSRGDVIRIYRDAVPFRAVDEITALPVKAPSPSWGGE